MLTEEEKTKIRLEESYRFEIQQELKPTTKPKKWYERAWSILNSTFTVFLLGTVVLGLFTRHLDNRRIAEEKRIAEDHQQDIDLNGYYDRVERQIDRLLFLDSDDEEYETEKKIVRANV